jgi:Cu2+-exporting ATPase
MVGDGVNDAPVLACADVSMAVANASALTRTSADVINLADGVHGLLPLLRLAKKTLRVVRQNLLWAALYNVTAIPLAALGIIAPWSAALGMSLSSLLVAANACRLWRSGLPQQTAPAATFPLHSRAPEAPTAMQESMP